MYLCEIQKDFIKLIVILIIKGKFSKNFIRSNQPIKIFLKTLQIDA